MNYTYANKLTVTVNEGEAFFNFIWVVPEYEEGKVVGEKTVGEQGIVMNKGIIDALKEMLNGLNVQKAN